MAPPKRQPLTFSSIKVGSFPAQTTAETAAAPDAAPGGGEPITANPVAPSRAPAAATPPPPAPETAPAASTVATTMAPQTPIAPPLAPPIDRGVLLARVAEPRRGPARTIYALAVGASILWAGGLTAFVVGYQARTGPFELDAFGVAVLALIALAPVGFIWAGAYAVAQAAGLAAETRRSRRMTDELIGPAALAAGQAGALVDTLRSQLATATEVANQAREHLLALREALAMETESLAAATAAASRTAANLVDTMSKERGEMHTLAVMLDARAASVADAINRQAHMVAEASDLAETQLREAEAALAARAADLAAAAGEATDASRVASEDLARQVARLETVGIGVGDQLRTVEDGLTQQRAALVTVAHALRADQEDFSTLAESRTAQLAEFLGHARLDVSALNEATTLGARSLSELIREAADKFHELADAARGERELFSEAALESLASLSDAGAREREHLESAMRSTIEALSTAAVEAREAADVHAEAARARVEQLNEAAFVAGQKADQVFDARLGEARGLIEQSARLVEDAGARTASRLEAQVGAARESLSGLQTLLDEVSARAARLPVETEAQAEEVKAVMAKGLSDLLASARRAADETQAIDAAFQERVRRNYEMLSEAVQLMGVVAQGGQGASVLQRSSPADRARARVQASAPPTPPAAPAAPLELPAPPQAEAEPPEAAEIGLRPRLKLTPTATDDEFKAVFDAAAPSAPSTPTAAAADEGAWSWKDLLTSIDGDAASDDSRAGEALFAEIEAMGIDPAALLPKSRIEEISAAIQTQDDGGAREVVRTLAPAAIRRLARRLLSDAAFRGRAQALVRRYSAVIDEATRRDRQGFQASALLSSNVGRAYLLLDAAAGLQG